MLQPPTTKHPQTKKDNLTNANTKKQKHPNKTVKKEKNIKK